MNEENPINPAALEALNKNLDALKATREGNKRETHAPSSAVAGAAVHFLSAMAVCSLIGYGVDYMLGTLPLGLLLGLMGGAGLGAKLLLRDMNKGNS